MSCPQHGYILANPATTRVATFNASRGEERWFSKEEMSTLDALGPIVRASSTLPILMPPVESTATPTSMAALRPQRVGSPSISHCAKATASSSSVLTRPRDYVKAPMPASVGALLRTAYRQFPSVFEGVAQRPDRYNAGRKFLFELEERGQAYVFAPDNLWINNTESRRERLEATYRAGLVQAVREMPAIKAFLGL